ncbi:dopaminechrome tautomerase-like [Neodiprion pinetum]|uniref:dopaminechrome tautomerase-like n=1 Tax=Neodiprion pinetum TaxID=441929 RepID=UPI001EDE296F|nr:major royal jelly protein 1-like [Neodiprion pinetum]
MIRLTFLACLLTIVVTEYPPLEVNFQWNVIKYSDRVTDNEVVKDSPNSYIAANNVISGIKLWKDYIYLTIPRRKSGVPVTLARIPLSATKAKNVTGPDLEAYPSWDMQLAGDCNAFQSVQSMEIDPQGRMWVLDTGRTETMADYQATKCPPRLVILDLENGGAVLRNIEFPQEIAAHNSSNLNDIVLDHQDGGYAYISDSGPEPAIIVYSLKDNKAHKVTHNSMKAESDAITFVVSDTTVKEPINIDGIALSPPEPNRTLYYSSVSSIHLYAIPVKVLQNSSVRNVQKYVVDVGRKTSQTSGMVMSNTGVLYYGLLADDAIAMWDTVANQIFASGPRKMYRNHQLLQWPDTFAFHENGRLWWVTNRFQNFLNNKVNGNEINYRIISSNVMQKSYQYFPNGTAPELPIITAAAGQIRIAISTAFAILLVFVAC